MMHATTVIAYTYDADYHCLDCYDKAIVEGMEKDDDDYLDNEGNPAHPIFASDEWYDHDNPEPQYLYCGDCHDEIAEYDPT